MVQISKNISVDGFEDQQTFDNWLREQDNEIPKEAIIKMFKWFLMRLEDNARENKINDNVIDGVDKYAIKVIKNKIMKEEDVIKYIRLAIGLEGIQ